MSERKIKILQLCLRSNRTVAEFDLFEEVIRAFDSDSYDVTYGIMLGEPDPDLRSRLNCKIKYFQFAKKNIRGLALPSLFILGKYLKKENFDVIITHRYKPSCYISLLSPFLKTRLYIAAYHGLHQFKRRSRKLLAKLFFNDKWRIVGVSDAVINDLSRSGIPQNLLVKINNAINIEKIRSKQLSRDEARSELKIGKDVFVISTIGITRAVKGHQYLIEGFSLFARSNPTTHLLIIGGGPLERQLREQANKLGISRQVTITGVKCNAYRYLRGTDLFIMTSLYEGLCIAILEAMATGLPVIATKVGGIPELLGDEGFFIPPKDANAIAASLQYFLNLPEDVKKDHAQKLHQRLQDRFFIDRYYQSYRDLIKDL